MIITIMIIRMLITMMIKIWECIESRKEHAICWNLDVNVDVVGQCTNRFEIYIIIVKIKPLHAHLNYLAEKCQVHVAKTWKCRLYTGSKLEAKCHNH